MLSRFILNLHLKNRLDDNYNSVKAFRVLNKNKIFRIFLKKCFLILALYLEMQKLTSWFFNQRHYKAHQAGLHASKRKRSIGLTLNVNILYITCMIKNDIILKKI